MHLVACYDDDFLVLIDATLNELVIRLNGIQIKWQLDKMVLEETLCTRVRNFVHLGTGTVMPEI